MCAATIAQRGSKMAKMLTQVEAERPAIAILPEGAEKEGWQGGQSSHGKEAPHDEGFLKRRKFLRENIRGR